MTPLERHEKAALSFSGGKDSTACVELLREHLDRITIYHLDSGDLLPEMRESVARVEATAPHFVRVESNVAGWIAEHGLPSDLMPYQMHGIGQMMGEHKRRITSRYECCFANLMAPLFARVHADGNTLLIRGTKRVDMPKLPAESGSLTDGVELWLPLVDWSNEDVFRFLAERNIPLPRIYAYLTNSPECAQCPAWWGEQRNTYLKRFYPDLWRGYQQRLSMLAAEMAPSVLAFLREWEGHV